MQSLYHSRNMKQPINRCPPSILCDIFLCLSDMATSEFFDGGPPPDVRDGYTWLRIILTCQYWHTVALLCPSLWSTIICGHAKLDTVSRYLKRSGQTCLKVHLSERKTTRVRQPIFYAEFRETLKLLIPHFHRVSVLNYNFNLLPREFTPLFNSHTPCLRELHLGIIGLDRNMPVIPVPSLPVFREAPIQTLHINSFVVWPVSHRSTLTTLVIRSPVLRSTGSSGLECARSLLETLRTHAMLQHLSLLNYDEQHDLVESNGNASGMGLGEFLQIQHSTPQIDWRNLHQLVIAHYPPHLASQFLGAITLSATTTLVIRHSDAISDIGQFLPRDMVVAHQNIPGLRTVMEATVIYHWEHDFCKLTLHSPSHSVVVAMSHPILISTDRHDGDVNEPSLSRILKIIQNGVCAGEGVRRITFRSVGRAHEFSTLFWRSFLLLVFNLRTQRSLSSSYMPRDRGLTATSNFPDNVDAKEVVKDEVTEEVIDLQAGNFGSVYEGMEIDLDDILPHTLFQTLLGPECAYALDTLKFYKEPSKASNTGECLDPSHSGHAVVHSTEEFHPRLGGLPSVVKTAYECRSPLSAGAYSALDYGGVDKGEGRNRASQNRMHVRTVLTLM
ncbi:unnamed protein product [Somion occarium]|uniref:F-box domain-containing protein n=1 Tax=Somion occarium TaxID=3059160 RepID=A0ABP1CWQ2_9APHY